MKNRAHPFKVTFANNKGSAIVIAILTLLVVTIIGLSTIDNSITEKTIATNDILYKKSFAAADGGIQVGMQLIEDSLRCGGEIYNNTYKTNDPNDSSDASLPNLLLKSGITASKPNVTTKLSEATLAVLDSDFAMDWQNPSVTNTSGPSDTKRDITFVEKPPIPDLADPSKGDALPHTNIAVIEKPLKGRVGFSILMADGYSGSGKSSGGDVIKPYDIHSRDEYRARNSCSHVVVEYHTDGKCDTGVNCDCAYQ